MSFAMMSKARMGAVSSRPSRTSSVCVRAEAVPENVASARAWINNWKTAQAGRPAAWFPGTSAPAHLDGSLPGDYGFDPLGLGKDAFKLKWYQQAELQNGRWAMLAVFGILFPELISSAGLGGPAAATAWFNAGTFDYFAPASSLGMVTLILFGWVEVNRYMDMINPGSVNQDPIFSNNKINKNTPGYPGFDPLGYSKGADFETLKVKELKNGRLAMLAFAGFAAQAYTTGKTPLAGLGAHLDSPWTTTVWQNGAHSFASFAPFSGFSVYPF